jgi:hypothetical protein
MNSSQPDLAQRSGTAVLIRLSRIGAVLVLLAVALPRTTRAQIAVVVHPSNSVEELSLDKLRRLFLGQARTFPAGGHARLVVHSSSAAASVLKAEVRSKDRRSYDRATELGLQLAVAF